MDFVVTGTGRCGTGFTAALFKAAGFRCGHEAYFTTRLAVRELGPKREGVIERLKTPLGRARESSRRHRSTLDGDASWMAVPRLSRFHGKVILQIRHPLAVIRSFTGTRFFSDPNAHATQHRYAAVHFAISGDDVLDSMRWWTFWNQRAAPHAHLVQQLEFLDENAFALMLELVGEPRPAETARVAVRRVSSGINSSASRGANPRSLTWDDLPAGADRQALAVAATALGYDPESEPIRTLI